MKKDSKGNIIYSPSDLILFMESPFASWMDRFYLEFPDEVQPDKGDAALTLLQDMGNKHENRYLKQLEDAGAQIANIPRKDAYEATVAAMRSGIEYIYQGELRNGNFAGRSDFLQRAIGKSDLGDYHYQLWDTKLSRKPKPYFLIQLCCYAELLENVQGVLPEVVGIVLGDGQKKTFRTLDYLYYYRQLKETFLKTQAAFDRTKQPIPDGMADHRRWTSHAEKILDDLDHLSRVANIRRTQIRKLESAGINTLTGLAQTTVPKLARLEPASFQTLKSQARLQHESIGLDRPKYQVLPHENNARRGFALLPPRSPMDVFFDMEGYPHIEGGLEYLFGVSLYEGNELKFNEWWAHDRQQEKVAFEQFMDWVYARWQADRSMHIYHYGDYEVAAMRRLMGRHATRERVLDDVLRNQVFVNLLTVVRQGLRVGTTSYSIKDIEHLCRDKRAAEIATAMDSVVFYAKWLEESDGDDCQTSRTLKLIRDYNKDDCDSTAGLATWLRDVQAQQRIGWIPPVITELSSEAAVARDQTSALAQDLLAQLPHDQEQARLQTILAQLLEFHWREARPVFWAKYDRREMTEQQLIDDPNCLGALTRSNTPSTTIQKSRGFEYRFDPAQDTKMDVGAKCFFAHDLARKAAINSLDNEAGLVTIKMGAKQLSLGDPPDRLSLIPDEYVDADPIAESIFRTVSNWQNTKQLSPAIETFLLRRRPVIKGNPAGPIMRPGVDITEAAIEAIKNMDNSTLCIQGPPGSGKTTKAARIIVELLKAGKTVGVASNSHKAIANLLNKVGKEAVKDRFSFNGTKIQQDKEDFGLDGTAFVFSKSASDVFGQGKSQFQLVGGTAWAFSHESAVGALDYLFVDEAGQVSVANLVGMSPSTRNIVVIGDQMQLSQPIKGAHPGESGQSILEYLLQDHQVIPDDLGIFLGTTHRMHPDVCHFISTAVYEGRLHASDETLQRSIVLPPTGIRYITKPTGILYIPVEHEGNTQGSDEEADTIVEIIQELRRCKFVDHGVEYVLTPEQILVVAPYNMQVKLLKTKHHRDYVGTVDKFQGLDAPVVIVSMCASDATESPRGIEFLLSKNRLNVAISRAKCLAIVVGAPALACTPCSQVEHLELVNLYCRIVQDGQEKQFPLRPALSNLPAGI